MPPLQSPRGKVKAAVVLLLTFASGLVDIVGYLSIYHLFVANMTGDTVRVGQKLITGNGTELLLAGSVIGAFVAGSIVGRAVIEAGARKQVKRIAGVTLLMEAALILAVMWSYPVPASSLDPASDWGIIFSSLVLLASAMGLQTATLTHVGPLTIHTTFVTGMLNQLAESVSKWLFWLHDEWKRDAGWTSVLRRARNQSDLRTAGFMGAIWLCYALGSLSGTLLNSRWSVRSLSVPIVLLVLAAGVDRFRPLSLEEEQE
jgi:uncharacterized membrane protein YoaK (UPF0700 family)